MFWFALLPTVGLALEEAEFPLTTNLYPEPADYFEGLHRDQLLDVIGGNSALDDMDYEITEYTASIIVPDNYEAQRRVGGVRLRVGDP